MTRNTTRVELKKTKDDSYDIFIETGFEKNLIEFLKSSKLGQKYAIITDEKVDKLYAQKLANELKKHEIECSVFSVPAGEGSKSFEQLQKVSEAMLAQNFNRKDAIIAYGGGVVGDLAGFIASTFMRGIAFIQIPTTLLAMVDSSVGGKTAINCSLGKNLIGAFYQPKAVFIDPKHLKTLSPKQIRNGLAEVIKYGVIYDKKFFEYLEENLEKILALNEPEITQIIKHSVEIKAEVVSEDETEKGKRMILNYGHTYGHAIEKMSDYKLLHGFAVSIGMILANEMAVEKGFLSEKEAQRVKQLIKKADLPTFTMKKPSLEDMKNDKKNSKNAITFILPTAIGSVKIFSHAY